MSIKMSIIDNHEYIYELVFNTFSNISQSGKTKEEKQKIIKIITKVIQI